MTARTLVQWPDKRLLEVSRPVENFDDSVVSVAEDLYHTMITHYGAGIAAPQIGYHIQMCVLDGRYVPDLPTETFGEISGCVAIVNPSISVVGDEKFTWEEACLSVPGVQGRVTRNKKIVLTYNNLKGDEVKAALEDIQAATVQHEIDHLSGKLYIHRMSGLERSRITKKLKKNLKASIVKSLEKTHVEKSSLTDAKRKLLRDKRKKKSKLRKGQKKKK